MVCTDLSHVLLRVYKHPSTYADIHTQDPTSNSKPNLPPLTPQATTATTTEAWATDLVALVAWAMAMAVDAAASADWALAMEAVDMASTVHHGLEDVDSLASTEILSQTPYIWALTGLSKSDYND